MSYPWDSPMYDVLFVFLWKKCVCVYVSPSVPSRRMPINHSSNPPWRTFSRSLWLQADILCVIFNLSPSPLLLNYLSFHFELCVCDPARPLLAAPYSSQQRFAMATVLRDGSPHCVSWEIYIQHILLQAQINKTSGLCFCYPSHVKNWSS